MGIGKILPAITICIYLFASTNGGRSPNIFKTIKTQHGDIYDCISIYEQPSLNHPSLKGHKVKMSPGKEAEELYRKQYPLRANQSFGLEDECPIGCVPIRRQRNDTFHMLYLHSRGIDFAGLFTKVVDNYRGARGTYVLYNPALVGPNEYSAGLLALTRGSEEQHNFVKAGWMVNPTLFGDTQTRLFTAWTNDNFQKTGCFNLVCPGFIMVSRNLPLGLVFKVSKPEVDPHWVTDFHITLEQDGNWWFRLYGSTIGYWPGRLFTTLWLGANHVRWGGEVYRPLHSSDISPQMGSGLFYNTWYDRTAYVEKIHLSSDKNKDVAFTKDNVGMAQSRCYHSVDNSYKNKREYSFLYGGTGGKDGSYCVAD